MGNLIGQSLGRYHILEQLGEGGMAVVYKAFDTRLERNVAIKVILPSREHSEKFLKRFEREAKALAQLSHPNIVKVIDYGEHEGLPYLVMEYLPGGTLKQKMTGKPLAWQEAARILLPVARALAYAHENKIVHRDIKPANILITQSGEPMLSDFGIAKMLEAEETLDLTGTGVGVGTPEYMSPEQAQGQPVDGRSDMYSLGVVFYEMVTGRKPYQADTPMAVVWKLASEPLPNPKQFEPQLPDVIEQVLLKLLAKNPENRYVDLNGFITAIENLQQGGGSRQKIGAGINKLSPRTLLVILGMAVVVVTVLLLTPSILGYLRQPLVESDQPSTATLAIPPSAAASQSPDFYDDFSSSKYDGSYDLEKWILNRGGGKIYQQDGILVADMDSTRQDGISLESVKYRNITIESPTFFEAKLMVKSSLNGHAFLFLGSNLSTGEFAFSDCTLGYGDVAALLDCGYVADGTTTLYRADDILENFGTWHTVRIEVLPETMTFTYYVDGQKLNSFTPPNAAKLKRAKFTMEIGLVGDSLGKWTAYIDDVRVGPLQEALPPSHSKSENPDAEGTYLALEDFESGKVQLYGFSADSNRWKIVDDGTGNKVFQVDNRDGSGSPGFSFGADDWKDYVAEYRVKYLNENGYLGLQVLSDGVNCYISNLSTGELYLAYGSPQGWDRLKTVNPPIETDRWYAVRVEAVKGKIQIFIDDNRWINIEDARVQQGWLLMFAEAGTYAQIDDIKILEPSK